MPLFSRRKGDEGGASPVHSSSDTPLKDGKGVDATDMEIDLLSGAELTLFERKAMLINREFDLMGVGRYQKCIWVLCGFGYLLDLVWAQAFSLAATPLYQELNVTGGDQSNIFTASSAGLTVGALFWGLAVDVIGRKWAFNLTCLITSVFGTLVAAPSNYGAICFLVAMCGFGLGGNIPIDASIVIEFLPQNRRWMLVALSMFQPLGVVLACAFAYGLVPRFRCDTTLPACSLVAEGVACCTRSSNAGWRYFLVVCGALTLGVFFLRFVVFTFHESPKFLLTRGRDAEAVAIVHKIAAFNKMPVPELTIEEFQALDAQYPQTQIADKGTSHSAKDVVKQAFSRFRHLKGLFRTKRLGFTTVLLWIVYMGDFWSFNLAGAFLPIILARSGEAAGQTVTETYRQYIYVYLPGIIGILLAAGMIEIPGWGRKWTLVFGALVQGVAMAMYTQVDTITAKVGLNALEYIAQSFFNACLYAFTPEVFPAPIRGSASGLCSSWGRLSGIVAPIAARPYIDGNSNGVLWLGVGGIFTAGFFLIFLPIETRGRQTY